MQTEYPTDSARGSRADQGWPCIECMLCLRVRSIDNALLTLHASLTDSKPMLCQPALTASHASAVKYWLRAGIRGFAAYGFELFSGSKADLASGISSDFYSNRHCTALKRTRILRAAHLGR